MAELRNGGTTQASPAVEHETILLYREGSWEVSSSPSGSTWQISVRRVTKRPECHGISHESLKTTSTCPCHSVNMIKQVPESQGEITIQMTSRMRSRMVKRLSPFHRNNLHVFVLIRGSLSTNGNTGWYMELHDAPKNVWADCKTTRFYISNDLSLSQASQESTTTSLGTTGEI